MAKIGDILQKATSLWSYLSSENKSTLGKLEDGEIIFSKNNGESMLEQF